MQSFEGFNIVVLDLETARSASQCRYCEGYEEEHEGGVCPTRGFAGGSVQRFAAIGWDNKRALGLSIGCYFSYVDGQYHWFDAPTLVETMEEFVTSQCLIVSFNGIQFDGVLMRAIVREWADEGILLLDQSADSLRHLCDAFKAQMADSYDILDQTWRQDPDNRYGKHNSLQALCEANGLPLKEMDGALAPRLWQEKQIARVLNYNQGDVRKTKTLFEMVCRGEPLQRRDGSAVRLPIPELERYRVA